MSTNMDTILAIDFGRYKSVACVYQRSSSEHAFCTIDTRPEQGMESYCFVNDPKHRREPFTVQIDKENQLTDLICPRLHSRHSSAAGGA